MPGREWRAGLGASPRKRFSQTIAMRGIRKKIVIDEAQHPVAVQIDYSDWLRIERMFNLQDTEIKVTDLFRYYGVVPLTEEPLAYQARVRNEWS
jgi:hypothetical protein